MFLGFTIRRSSVRPCLPQNCWSLLTSIFAAASAAPPYWNVIFKSPVSSAAAEASANPEAKTRPANNVNILKGFAPATGCLVVVNAAEKVATARMRDRSSPLQTSRPRRRCCLGGGFAGPAEFILRKDAPILMAPVSESTGARSTAGQDPPGLSAVDQRPNPLTLAIQGVCSDRVRARRPDEARTDTAQKMGSK